MIIDDVHRFAFIHIPKCAGTSVRRQLEFLDSYDRAFYGRHVHEQLGELDLGHLPLPVARTWYPEAYAKIVAYRSFALVRDPFDRFASATCESLAAFGGVAKTTITTDMALREAEVVIDRIMEYGSSVHARYIHFTPQTDFVILDGEPIVSDVFAVEDMAGFGEAIRNLTGAAFDPGKSDYANFAASTSLVSLARRAKPIYSRLTSWRQREAILALLKRLRLQSPEGLYSAFRRHPRIKAFIETHYAEDFALHAAAKARIDRRPRGWGSAAS